MKLAMHLLFCNNNNMPRWIHARLLLELIASMLSNIIITFQCLPFSLRIALDIVRSNHSSYWNRHTYQTHDKYSNVHFYCKSDH